MQIADVFKRPNWTLFGLAAAVFVVHFICFYWWVSGSYYFSGDALFYFSRRITSLAGLWAKFTSLDDLYQYRPLPYAVFSFVLYPLFGTNPAPYHAVSYLIALANTLLACGCCYFWLSGDMRRTLIASLFLILNPVNFFPSYGLTYIDVLLSVFFYFLALFLIVSNYAWAPLLAPLFAVLALCSREHSILLPLQASLILLATGVSLRDVAARTRNLWIVVALYAAFQLVIREGAIFAPETANRNLQFEFSLERVEALVKGVKSAGYFPEVIYSNKFLNDYRRPAQIAFVVAWSGMILWVLLRRDRVGLSGFIWAPLSLLPIAFIRFLPFPRHYYLALPGLAILFASAVRRTRFMPYLATVFAIVTVTSVSIYAQASWIAQGSRQTRRYFGDIQSIIDRTGRTDFYVLSEGDPNFYWHIDGGSPVHEFLDIKPSFHFVLNAAPLPMDRLLSNSLNVVVPSAEGLNVAMESGRFPTFQNDDMCKVMSVLTGANSDCAVYFRGFSIDDDDKPVVETPAGLPIFRVNGEIVTLSRTTVFLNTRKLEFNATLKAAPESTDGVGVEIYRVFGGRFYPLYEKGLAPGERIDLKESFETPDSSMLVLRVSPGKKGDETRDWLIWTPISNAPGFGK